MPIIHPEVTILFPAVLNDDGRQLTADEVAIDMPFVIRPPYIEHEPGQLSNALAEQCEGQQPEVTASFPSASQRRIPVSAGNLVLTHTVEGDGTYGTVRINRLTAKNLELAQFALKFGFQVGLNPLEPDSVTVNFVARQD